jgi:hypothetical protein
VDDSALKARIFSACMEFRSGKIRGVEQRTDRRRKSYRGFVPADILHPMTYIPQFGWVNPTALNNLEKAMHDTNREHSYPIETQEIREAMRSMRWPEPDLEKDADALLTEEDIRRAVKALREAGDPLAYVDTDGDSSFRTNGDELQRVRKEIRALAARIDETMPAMVSFGGPHISTIETIRNKMLEIIGEK